MGQLTFLNLTVTLGLSAEEGFFPESS